MHYLIASLIILFSQVGAAKDLITLKEYLKSELSSSAKMSKETFPLSDEDKKGLALVVENFDDTSFTFYYGKTADGTLEKACNVVNQKGKEGPITVGVCFSSVGMILSVVVLAHQEEHGKSIAEQTFLKQFKGKKMSDAFIVGKDIDGISGATWSSKYMSEAIRKTSFAFKKFKGENK